MGIFLGIELGSTRIKAVLTDKSCKVLAGGEHAWENKFIDGIWTYSLEDIWAGVQSCYASLKKDYFLRYSEKLTKVSAIGISAMMHGYMVFDTKDNLLTPFRTWRNNNAEYAANELTKAFSYPVPARWSIAHLYQAILNKEPHIKNIAFQTSLEGYVHYMLTGEKVIGIGEASGMFPIDLETKNYDEQKINIFEKLAGTKGADISLRKIFPKVLIAGDNAGYLTEKGAKLLDVDGDLKAGIPMCPPEGDAGTGMVATNSVRRGTGNVSAGTSIFGMAVLDGDLNAVHPEIDLVTTPSGELVAMVHCNNCTSEINAWFSVFKDCLKLFGVEADSGELYNKLFNAASEGDVDCGGLLAYNYLSGENITGVDAGRPLFVRTTESKFTLNNFIRTQIYSTAATLKIGFDILRNEENVKLDNINGHGGIFKTEGIYQKILAAALNTPVTVFSTANEGGAWGMAVLAGFMLNKGNETLADYLDKKVFNDVKTKTVMPDKSIVAGLEKFQNRFISGLPIVKEAVKVLKE